jgi:transposase-like protein
MIRCPHCQGSERQVKVGYNPSGSQRYLCRACGRKYTPVPSVHGYSEPVRQEALRLYGDGMNQRRIARTLKVSHQTVANWIKAYAERLPDQPPVPATQPLEVNELDELFTFIGSKKTKSMSSPK